MGVRGWGSGDDGIGVAWTLQEHGHPVSGVDVALGGDGPVGAVIEPG